MSIKTLLYFQEKKTIRQNLKGTQLYFYKTPTLSSTNLI